MPVSKILELGNLIDWNGLRLIRSQRYFLIISEVRSPAAEAGELSATATI